MSDAMPGPGSVLASYEIVDEIGRGGLGVVYRGRHVHLGRDVALKVLHPYWTTSPEFVKRFREEGRLMAILNHPNILQVYDAGQSGPVFFLAMAFLEGQTLEALITDPIPQEAALHVARQLCHALSYAHAQGVVHRDVKPANIMVSPRGVVTLMDFGVARLRDAPGLTMPGVRIGTPFYMAPEQILGKKADGRADLYALGVVLHQLLAGRLPFAGPSTEEVYEGHLQHEPGPLGDQVPKWLDRVLRRALAKSPADRFPDADTLLAALESRGDEVVLQQLGIQAAPAWQPSPAGSPLPAAGPGTARVPTGVGKPTALTKEDRTALTLDVVESSRMKHAGMTLVVREQFSVFRDYVKQHLERYGCLDSLWSGDGLVALFAKTSQGAGCAAAILDGLAAFNESNGEGWMPMRVRIGVHHGPIVMAPGQPLGEVTSRTLDIAGHLQKTAPENSVMASEITYFGLPDSRGWVPAGDEYLLVFPFRLYRYAPERRASGPGTSGVSERPSPSRIEYTPPLEVILARAVAAEPGLLRVEVTTGSYRKEYDVRDEAVMGRPDAATGRVPEIDLRQDEAVSRRHARLFRGTDGFFVEDLDSANGTMLNGDWLTPVKPVALQEGDRIELGEVTVIRVLSLGREAK